MPDDLATVTERLKQNRATRPEFASPASPSVAASPLLTAAGFLPGDRVFDTVSGLEGVVVDGARENVVVPAPK